MNRRPHLVHPVDPAPEAVVDVTLALRADIMGRDWSAVHVRGDRAKPLPFFERIKRTWWK
jgi:hypothetical protein